MKKINSMSDIAYARVVKCDSNRFVVDTADGLYVCTARKKIKQNSSGIISGDLVVLEQEEGAYVVSEVLARKNSFIRPSVSNIDQIIAVASVIPKIDFFLIDKLIINAHKQGVEIVLCLNKSDLSTELCGELRAQYSEIVDKIVVTSATERDISELKAVLPGKLSCFAGQSAVGKSSLINALCGESIQRTNSLSEKAERGKNTTTRAEIIKLDKNTYIIDTPGFSMLDIHDISCEELDLFYPEYVAVAHQCKYHRCTHTVEPDCRVRTLVETGTLNPCRYERYCAMLQELKNAKNHVRKEFKSTKAHR